MTATLVADYLVVGSGAMGLAFTDVLLAETDATFILVDRHHRPGGHWNDSYPFVRLHQPSSFYGVNSKALGSDQKDQTGWNAGLYELATGAEVCAYFDQVMNQQFLPSGRVRYFPMCEYQGDGRFVSRTSGREFTAKARKTVDATYMNVTVPSVQPPRDQVANGVRCVPLNDLPRVESPPSGYVVVGAGKTGMDACLWLLANEVEPSAITWIMPRDSWLLDRETIQPGAEFFNKTFGGISRQMEVIAGAGSIRELFEGVNACGQLLRLDDDVWPTMYRCATVTHAELEQLRRIQNIVRLGRIERIDRDEIVLEQGTVPTDPQRLHIDCSADGLAHRPVAPVFAGDQITLQSLRTCQQVFSAAFVAHIESQYDDESKKNELCTVVPHPNTDIDFLRTTLANNLNQIRWAQDPALTAWLAGARLDVFSRIGGESAAADPASQATLAKFGEVLMGAIANLQKLLANVDEAV